MAMWNRLKNWFKGLFDSDPKLTVSISNELLTVYSHLAARAGISLDVWVRRALTAAIPQVELRKLEQGALYAIGLEQAHQQLDEAERMLPSFLSVREAERPTPKKSLPMVEGHPCVFLRPEYPSGWTKRDCQGTCSSTKTGFRGRVCQWAATVANECEAFEPKANGVRPGA